MGLHHVPRHVPPLSTLLADLGHPAPAAWARALGISERTAWRWQRSDRAPRPARLALYWVTTWGWSEIDSEARHTLRNATLLGDAYRREIATLRTRIARLEAIGDFGAANAPLIDAGVAV